MRLARWSHRTARMLAARIARDTKMRPAKRRAQFDTTISPIVDPEGAVKQLYCAILCDLVRSCAKPGSDLACRHYPDNFSDVFPVIGFDCYSARPRGS